MREFKRADEPNYRLGNIPTADRLENGNMIITSWIAGDDDMSHWLDTVQAFKVTPEKKIAWALSSWKDPDLGRATRIQLLDQPGNPDVVGQER